MLVPTMMVDTSRVDALLLRAQAAYSTASMVAWLSGPMTQNVQRRAQERFLDQGEDVSGGGWSPWEPLLPTTREIRASYGFGPLPINVRTGELERYITGSASKVSPTGTGAAMVYPDAAPSGWLEEKVRTAQAGKVASASKSQTPARPVLGLSTPDLEFALVSLGTWLVTAINGGGSR